MEAQQTLQRNIMQKVLTIRMNEQPQDSVQTGLRFTTPKSESSTKKREVAAFNTLRERERMRQRVLCLRQYENLHRYAENLYRLYNMRVYEAESERSEYMASKQRIRQNKQNEASYRKRRAYEQRGSHVEQLIFAKQTFYNSKQQSVAAIKDEQRELRYQQVANVRIEREKIAACHAQLYLSIYKMRVMRNTLEMQKLEKIHSLNDEKSKELERMQQEAESEIYRLRAEERVILKRLAAEKSAKKREDDTDGAVSAAAAYFMAEYTEDDTDEAFREELKQYIEAELRYQSYNYPYSSIAEENVSTKQQNAESAATE